MTHSPHTPHSPAPSSHADQQQQSQPPALHCCQGQPAPPMVTEGWQHLLAMRTSARQAFADLLAASIHTPEDPSLDASLGRLCEAHGIEQHTALTALRACQFLLQQAAALDLGAEPFIEDLQKLGPNDAGGLRLLASRFEPLKQRLRQQLLEQSLADHGKVLVDLDWRMDHVASSARAVNLNSPVVFLTLQLRDATGPERVTLQLTGHGVQLLRQFCQRFSDSGGNV